MPSPPHRPPKSPEHFALGQYLRAIRLQRGYTQRNMGIARGTVSEVENGIILPSKYILDTYMHMGIGGTRREELARLHWAALMVDRQITERVVNTQQTAERRRALINRLRLVMDQLAGEIRGFSEFSLGLIEQLDEHTVKRLIEGREEYRAFLKGIDMPEDWLDTLAEPITYDSLLSQASQANERL